jgi:Caspase domain
VGAVIESEADIEIDSIPADSALDYMEQGGAANSIVILDACRNTPVVRRVRSLGRGYAPIEKRGSSLIAVSTSTGEFAVDGDGENSPYAAALAREMRVPGQGILDMFINVRNAVIKDTRGAQEPTELSSSLSRNFPFTVKVEVTVSVPQQPAAAPPLAPGILARDFATVPTGTSPDAIVMAGPYLRDGPVLMQVRDVSPPGAEVAFYNNRALYEGKAVAPTISQNMLTMRNTGNVAASFTLTLPAPAAKVSFMIPRMFPETQSGITFPSWKATALSASGIELDTRSRALARKLADDMEREVVTLRAPAFEGISAVRFDSDPRLNGTPFAAFSAILIEGVWVEGMK